MSEPIDRPDLEREGWTLEEAEGRSASNPNTFLIPSQSERSAIQVGQGAKLLFWIQSEDEQIPICERMWVLVEERLQDGRYVGSLANTPETPGSLSRGQRLVFGPEHVADIFTGQSAAPAS